MTIQEILNQIPVWIKTGIPMNVKSYNIRALLTWITIRSDVQEVGRLKITKVSGNVDYHLEVGDKVTGIVEDTHIINAIYLGGNINLLSSYAVVNDPNYGSTNPTQNEYETIDALKLDQANQTQGFNQKVIDASGDPNASPGSAIYYYKGNGTSQLTDYIRLSDASTALSNFLPKGNYPGTAEDLKADIDAIGNNPGVTTVTGDGVDNTDPDNPIIYFPTADEIDDSQTTKKLVDQALIDKVTALDQAIVLKNTPFDASIGTFPANTEAGWAYIVGTPGTVNGITFSVGDRLTSLLDNASTTTFAGNWFHEDYSDVSFKGELEASSIKATPVDADLFGYLDSAASNVLKKFSWGNIKTTLKTYFDTVYAPINGTIPTEEQIIGTATENTAATGTLNQDLNTFSDKYLTLIGNTTLTFSNTPASGKSFAKTMTIKSTATETLALPAGYIVLGTYANTGVENYLTFKFSNFPTVGLKVVVTIDKV